MTKAPDIYYKVIIEVKQCCGAGAEIITLFRLRLRKVSYKKSIFINSIFSKIIVS